MQNVYEKLSFVLNLLKFLGVYYEPFSVKSKWCEKLLQMWPIYMFRFHLISLLFMDFWCTDIISFNPFDLKGEFLLQLTMHTFFALALFVLLFVYRNRKQNKKFWRAVTEADDFLTRFLKVKIDYDSENREMGQNCLIYVGINLVAFIFSVYRTLERSGNQVSQNICIMYYMLITRFLMVNYVFFVKILSNRFKILVDNYKDLKDTGSNLLVVMRVHSIIWKLTRKIEVMFKWTMVTVILIVLLMGFCYSHVFSDHLIERGFLLIYLRVVVVIMNIAYVCVYCNELCSMVRKIYIKKII